MLGPKGVQITEMYSRSLYPNMLGPKGVQITEMYSRSEAMLFVCKAEHFPFNAQQNIYEYHYFGGSDK